MILKFFKVVGFLNSDACNEGYNMIFAWPIHYLGMQIGDVYLCNHDGHYYDVCFICLFGK